MAIKRIAVMTGGGDCPGLNAVIYGALLKAYGHKDTEVIGIKKGWEVFDIPKEQLTPEVVKKYTVKLNIAELDDLQTKGGTILYTSRTNPFKAVGKAKSGEEKEALRKKIGETLLPSFLSLG